MRLKVARAFAYYKGKGWSLRLLYRAALDAFNAVTSSRLIKQRSLTRSQTS
jgi:hypothetical protein